MCQSPEQNETSLVITFLFRSTRRQRIISAPTNGQKPVPKKIVENIPTVEIDSTDVDDDALPPANGDSYTEATSSSAYQVDADENQQCARQSMLHTLMIHWHAHPPSEMSKWEAYRDFGDKFSASISSTVYRDFERIILWTIRSQTAAFCTIELHLDFFFSINRRNDVIFKA